jgi:hypothetical protein
MRTITRVGTVTLLVWAAPAVWGMRPTGTEQRVAVGSRISVAGATEEQVEMVRWAVDRFEAAGLHVPPVEIRFHGDAAGCGGHFGYARAGRVDVCTTLVNAMARRNLLHEMAHLWLDANADGTVRLRFLAARGLRAWNVSADPWSLRGYEQGAEIIAWVIGERILTAQVPDPDPAGLVRGYEILTGLDAPARTG